MKLKSFLFTLCLLLSAAGFAEPVQEGVLAFPGAEGFGRFTSGGRGGKVVKVTNLEDFDKGEPSIPGSLRSAILKKGPKIIVFDVAGTIYLKRPLAISRDSITIAGQTAPEPGITLAGHSVRITANNVILRYIRCRLGDINKEENDALYGIRKQNIIIDHCSVSWCTDECASFYSNQNFTMQWCLISESLRESVHVKGAHGYGGIWGGQGATFHHNLLAHHDSRNPRFCGSRYSGRPDLELVDFRNNVIYNWGSNSAYAAEGGNYNIVNNYYKPGPATKKSTVSRIIAPNADDGKQKQNEGVWGKFYVTGNFIDGSVKTDNVSNSKSQQRIADANRNNWLDGVQPNEKKISLPIEGIGHIRSTVEFEVAPISMEAPNDAFESVLQYCGASNYRDSIDTRVIDETRNGTAQYGPLGNGIINSQEEVGGYLQFRQVGTTPTDSDKDGMPDEWEIANGLNPNQADDNLYTLSKEYTNIEMYINSLVTVPTVKADVQKKGKNKKEKKSKKK